MITRFIAYFLFAIMLGVSIGQARAEWDITDPNQIDLAIVGQGADIASTVASLAMGAVEVNPIFGDLVAEDPLKGLLLMSAGKYLLIRYADSKPFPECVQGRATSARMGFALAGHNVASTGSWALGQSLGIKALSQYATPIGILAGISTWIYTREAALENARAKCSSR